MNNTKPIKSVENVQKLKQYYLERGEYRDHLLVTICLNSALRISDVLKLKWEDIYDTNKKNTFNTHIELKEQKTRKINLVYINESIKDAVKKYINAVGTRPRNGYIFTGSGNKPITRMQAYRIINRGGKSIGLDISPHSLRKTFGYHAWKQGVPPVLLMQIYNHSSFEITKRYLGITQEEKDEVYLEVQL